MEVPCFSFEPVLDECDALRISVPGALMSTQAPWLLKSALPSAGVVAPTVIALGSEAGEALHA